MELTFTISFKKNEGLILSPSELKDIYLFGVNLKDVRKGTQISDDTISTYIKSAQQEIENLLGVKIKRQKISESRDFYVDDWNEWGIIKVSYPANKVCSLKGWYNEVQQIDFPENWVSVKRSSEGRYYRHLHLVPSTTGSFTGIMFAGAFPYLGVRGTGKKIPDYWRIVYITGFEQYPYDILDIIGKIATLNIFNIASDLIFGVSGISGYGLGIDGLSQSFSANPYGNRIKTYLDELSISIPRLEKVYKGITFASL